MPSDPSSSLGHSNGWTTSPAPQATAPALAGTRAYPHRPVPLLFLVRPLPQPLSRGPHPQIRIFVLMRLLSTQPATTSGKSPRASTSTNPATDRPEDQISLRSLVGVN